MHLYITRKAQTELTALSHEVRTRIVEKIRFFMRYRDPFVFAKYIAIEKIHRWRVGNYRIFFERHGEMLIVIKIARRDKAYD